MVRQRRARIGTVKPKLARMIFTLDELVFLKKALVPLEEIMLVQKAPLPNVTFALATVTQVQAKIQMMMQRGICGEQVELDANEVLILQTAIWMFEAILEGMNPSLEKERLQQRCQTLNAILAIPARRPHNSR